MRRHRAVAHLLSLVFGLAVLNGHAADPSSPPRQEASAQVHQDTPRAEVEDESSAQQDQRATLLRQLQGSEMLGVANIPVAQTYLDELLRRIQAAGPQPVRPAQVVIRPKLSYNAATTASGLIIVDLGWLKTIDSEAELLALLAHEYGHVAAEHLGTKNQIGGLTHVGGLIARAVAMRNKVDNSLGISAAQGGWSALLKPNWSRKQEYEADAFALEITQQLGVPFVPGVRAFLDRIRSVEAQAASNAANTSSENQKPGTINQAISSLTRVTGLSQDHPSIEERIEQVQKLAEGRPRIRPRAGPDPWLQVRDSVAFKESEEEYILAARFMEAAIAKRPAETAEIAQQLAQRPKPFRTAAVQTIWASVQQDPQARMRLLKEAIGMPDVSNAAYQLLANLQRDQRRYEEGYATALAGLERFDSHSSLWPDMLAFQRTLLDLIEATPQNQKSTELNAFAVQIQTAMLALRARCLLDAEMSSACNQAALNAEQQRRLDTQEKARSDETARKLTNRMERLFR